MRAESKQSGAATLAYWAVPPEDVLSALASRSSGLSTEEARARQKVGTHVAEQRRSKFRILVDQIKSPLLILLVFASAASAISGEWVDSAIVMLVITGTVGISYRKESGAELALRRLRAKIENRGRVIRDGLAVTVPLHQIVSGDVIELTAGSLVPADALIIEANSLFVSESALTGEAYPIEKLVGRLGPDTPPARRTNCVFLGSNVRSGTAKCIVTAVGTDTVFGEIAQRLVSEAPETEFERGIRHFGYLVLSFMAALTLFVFFVNVEQGRGPLDTLLFSIALAVGLSPELLPAILTTNLARAAHVMAEKGVLVRHLNAIENLGEMDVLCTDKTGTLTEGVIKVEGAYDHEGRPSSNVLETAAVNSALQSGLLNPLDDAILRELAPSGARLQKLGEIPYDFTRKRLSVVYSDSEGTLLITKGAFQSVIELCDFLPDGTSLRSSERESIRRRFEKWSQQGIRVLAVARRTIEARTTYEPKDEQRLTFLGFVTFRDALKEGARESIERMASLGIAIKLVSGDNALVCKHVAQAVGLPDIRVMTGSDIRQLSGPALWHAVDQTSVFAEVDPAQKEDIVIALKRTGRVVGFMGDGINDTPAMHAADVSVSVDGATDVARATADFVLLERHLEILEKGVEEGRRTFANTLKYILITMSANLGNTVSIALASLFLPFLPLLPGQILLNNFLSDIPAIGLAGDTVDYEQVARAERWDMRAVARFMLVFGIMSSVFDIITFATLTSMFGLDAPEIRTGWFLESLLTELTIIFIVRTRRSVLQSSPGRVLKYSTIGVGLVGVIIPYMPFTEPMGFIRPSAAMIAAVLVIVACYGAASEFTKRRVPRSPLESPSRTNSRGS